MTNVTQKEHSLAMAIKLAAEAHHNQFDQAGKPYISHPLRVMQALAHESVEVQVVAILHDVVEDTEVTLDTIRQYFGESVAEAVDALTHRGTKDGGSFESYRDYLARVKTNEVALKVKHADIADNSRIDRLLHLDFETQKRLSLKYLRAKNFLVHGIWHQLK